MADDRPDPAVDETIVAVEDNLADVHEKVDAAGANLCLLMRTLVGVGTPRSLQGHRELVSQLVQALIDAFAALVAWWALRRRLLAALGVPLGSDSISWPDRVAGALGSPAGARPAFTTGC